MSEVETNYESEARQLGWVPQEQFRGDTSNWVDAKTFVERGQQQLPILRENNRRLKGDIDALRGQVSKLQSLFNDSQESIVELKKYHEETFNSRIKAEQARLRAEIAGARESGDVEGELLAQEKLFDLKTETAKVEKEAKKAPEAPAGSQTGPAEELAPEFLDWRDANPWFEKDRKKTILAMALAQEVRAANPGLTGKAFFKALDAEIEGTLPDAPRGSKVEGSRGGSSPGGGGNSYADLPADAKAQCDKDERKFVGEGRAFKTQAEWRKHFASLYF